MWMALVFFNTKPHAQTLVRCSPTYYLDLNLTFFFCFEIELIFLTGSISAGHQNG